MNHIFQKRLCTVWKLVIILICFISPNFANAQASSGNNCFAVVAERNNFFYEGIDNPISLIGIFSDYSNIIVSSKTGIVESLDSGKYIVRSLKWGRDTITVAEKTSEGIRIIYEEIFSVKQLPQPVASLAGKSYGGISKAEVSASPKIVVQLINMDVEKSFEVLGFKFVILSNDTSRNFMPLESNNEYLTDEMRRVVQDCYRGDWILIYSIYVRISEGVNRLISPIELRLI